VTPGGWRSWHAAGVRAKLGQLQAAFPGSCTAHHGVLLAKLLARVDALDADSAELDPKLGELTSPLASLTFVEILAGALLTARR
jgi:hypothetical protein